jgi:ubiquitin-conjugating enzyme E2 variant
LPRHDDFTWLRRAGEAGAIALALGLLCWHVVRLLHTPGLLAWWLPFAILGGVVAADLVSGLIHWTADTWGSETMPILGRRFVRPFRVHHVNPDDFLRRRFLDTNGDVAMIVSGFLGAAFVLPLDSAWGAALAVFVVAFCAAGLPTNQVHQWAHMPQPPAPVRWLQERGIILSRAAHQVHHQAPYATHYCIATGWCNRLLARIDFFRRLERLITRLTGIVPRADDASFQSAFSRLRLSGSAGAGSAKSQAGKGHDE